MPERWKATRDRGMIVVPLELLEKIDRNRDELSRVEFIEFCVDTLLGYGEVAAFTIEETAKAAPIEKTKDAEAPISRSEFEDFKKGLKDLQRAYIDFLINYTLEPIDKASLEKQERFKEQVINLLEE